MSLADQLQRVIYKLKTEGAKDVQKDFEKIEDAAEGVAREAINVEKAVATIGIQAEQTQSRLKRMVDAGGSGFNSLKGTLGQIGGGFQSAIKGVNDLTSKLGPWNQALELGGKAVKFVDESFDALAKKEPGRRAEIEATRKSFHGLGDSVKQVTAELALFVADGWKPVEDALKRAQKIEAEIRKAYGLDRGGAAAQGLGYLVNGGAADALRETLASSWGGGLDETIGAGLDRLGEAGKKLDEENKKKAAENERRHKSMLAEWAKRERDVLEFIGKRSMDDDVVGKPIGFSMGAVADTTQRNAYGAVQDEGAMLRGLRDQYEQGLTDKWRSTLEANRSEDNKTLETLFGPISEFDAYQQSFEALGATFDTFAQAIGAGYAALVTGQGSVIGALKATAAAGILAQGQQSAIAAVRELALGFGALALGSPTSAAHFKSAALHGAVSVAAGIAAKGLGAGSSAPSAPASAGGSSASGGASAGGGVSRSESQKEQRPIIVNIGSEFQEDSPRMRAQRASEAVDRALRLRDE